LGGDYLAIATLGFGEIIRVVILNVDAVGGARGFALNATSGVDLRFEDLGAIYAVVALSVGVIARLAYSSAGLAFRAVREDETAAESIGVATTRVKVLAFVVSSFFAGVAGAGLAPPAGCQRPHQLSLVRALRVLVLLMR